MNNNNSNHNILADDVFGNIIGNLITYTFFESLNHNAEDINLIKKKIVNIEGKINKMQTNINNIESKLDKLLEK